MQKTILIGALLFSSISGFASDMDRCNSAVSLAVISINKGTEAIRIRDFKGACSYSQVANSFIEDAMANCSAKNQAELRGVYIQVKQVEASVCNQK